MLYTEGCIYFVCGEGFTTYYSQVSVSVPCRCEPISSLRGSLIVDLLTVAVSYVFHIAYRLVSNSLKIPSQKS